MIYEEFSSDLDYFVKFRGYPIYHQKDIFGWKKITFDFFTSFITFLNVSLLFNKKC